MEEKIDEKEIKIGANTDLPLETSVEPGELEGPLGFKRAGGKE